MIGASPERLELGEEQIARRRWIVRLEGKLVSLKNGNFSSMCAVVHLPRVLICFKIQHARVKLSFSFPG